MEPSEWRAVQGRECGGCDGKGWDWAYTLLASRGTCPACHGLGIQLHLEPPRIAQDASETDLVGMVLEVEKTQQAKAGEACGRAGVYALLDHDADPGDEA